MRIGVLGAMPEEIREFGKLLVFKDAETIGQREYRAGRLNRNSPHDRNSPHEIVTVFSRWGKVAAASTATTLIDRFRCDLLIFTGVAGAASVNVALGDIVVADRLVQHDVDASGTGYFERFEIPLLDQRILELDQILCSKAAAAAEAYSLSLPSEIVPETILKSFGLDRPMVHRGLVASGDQFINQPGHVAELTALLGPIACVEMEGAAVGQVAFEHGVPLIVIRSISDRADGNAHLDFPKFVRELASHYSAGILSRMIELL